MVVGPEATGKSIIVSSVLEDLAASSAGSLRCGEGLPVVRFAIVKSLECISSRHLFEKAIALVNTASHHRENPPRCESLSQLSVELGKSLGGWDPNNDRFVLVFDGIDNQRDAPPTLLPALARLSEVVSSIVLDYMLV